MDFTLKLPELKIIKTKTDHFIDILEKYGELTRVVYFGSTDSEKRYYSVYMLSLYINTLHENVLLLNSGYEFKEFNEPAELEEFIKPYFELLGDNYNKEDI